jgi:hypothetical protein
MKGEFRDFNQHVRLECGGEEVILLNIAKKHLVESNAHSGTDSATSGGPQGGRTVFDFWFSLRGSSHRQCCALAAAAEAAGRAKTSERRPKPQQKVPAPTWTAEPP